MFSKDSLDNEKEYDKLSIIRQSETVQSWRLRIKMLFKICYHRKNLAFTIDSDPV
jgi:hypothetical protein